MNINQYALEITKLYMGKKILNDLEPSQYAKEFNNVYQEVCEYLKSIPMDFVV